MTELVADIMSMYCIVSLNLCPLLSLQQLSMLPLMEPLIGVNFAHFPPYGSGQLSGENRLSGSFGSASLDGVSDYYSQLIYKVWLLRPLLPLLYYNYVKKKIKKKKVFLFVWACSRTILAILQHLLPHCPPHRHLLPGRSCWTALPLQRNWPKRPKLWVSMRI